MARTYQRTPCRSCGGDKAAHGKSGHSRYCAACLPAAMRERWTKWFYWYCGSCDSPHYCVTCARIKRERFAEARRLRAENRQRSSHPYFRPFNAERFWQHRAHSAVAAAVKRGLLPNLKPGEYACTDCGGVAHEYDHRDYARPLEVQPVCRSCNKQRGTARWPSAEQFQFAKLAPPADQGVRDAA